MVSQKVLFRGLIGLICVEMGLALAYLMVMVRQGEVTPLLDFNRVRSLPSLVQVAHLGTIGVLSLLVLWLRRRMTRPLSWFLPLALALLCFYGALDELFKIHLYVPQYHWKGIYLGVLVAIPLLAWRDFLWLGRHHRGTVLGVAIGMGIFLLGGFGAEMLRGAIATEIAAHPTSRLLVLSEYLRVTVEEFAELLGETVILYAFARFVHALLQRNSYPSLKGERQQAP